MIRTKKSLSNNQCTNFKALGTAIQKDCVEAVNILVDEGADIYSLDFDNTTALQFAAINFKVDMINNIIQRCYLPHKTIIEFNE
jgi:ankyrin repeat protein